MEISQSCITTGNSSIPVCLKLSQRICWEVEMGNSGTGRVALAVVDPASTCPTSGGAGWYEAAISNGNTNIETVRLGVPATNNFNANEGGTFVFDSFESYRTITP